MNYKEYIEIWNYCYPNLTLSIWQKFRIKMMFLIDNIKKGKIK